MVAATPPTITNSAPASARAVRSAARSVTPFGPCAQLASGAPCFRREALERHERENPLLGTLPQILPEQRDVDVALVRLDHRVGIERYRRRRVRRAIAHATKIALAYRVLHDTPLPHRAPVAYSARPNATANLFQTPPMTAPATAPSPLQRVGLGDFDHE